MVDARESPWSEPSPCDKQGLRFERKRYDELFISTPSSFYTRKKKYFSFSFWVNRMERRIPIIRCDNVEWITAWLVSIEEQHFSRGTGMKCEWRTGVSRIERRIYRVVDGARFYIDIYYSGLKFCLSGNKEGGSLVRYSPRSKDLFGQIMGGWGKESISVIEFHKQELGSKKVKLV